jgi:hypothetical protein
MARIHRSPAVDGVNKAKRKANVDHAPHLPRLYDRSTRGRTRMFRVHPGRDLIRLATTVWSTLGRSGAAGTRTACAAAQANGAQARTISLNLGRHKERAANGDYPAGRGMRASVLPGWNL